MSGQAATMRASLATRWASAKPIALALAVGLIAGPIISGIAGFQIRASTAQAASRAGIVEQQASFCAERARASGAVTAGLGWQARNDLARQHAMMPGTTTVDSDVTYACSTKLAG